MNDTVFYNEIRGDSIIFQSLTTSKIGQINNWLNGLGIHCVREEGEGRGVEEGVGEVEGAGWSDKGIGKNGWTTVVSLYKETFYHWFQVISSVLS